MLSILLVMLPSTSTMSPFLKWSIDVKSVLLRGMRVSMVMLTSVLSEFKNDASAI